MDFEAFEFAGPRPNPVEGQFMLSTVDGTGHFSNNGCTLDILVRYAQTDKINPGISPDNLGPWYTKIVLANGKYRNTYEGFTE